MKIISTVLFLFFAINSFADTSDWNQWRGPNRDGMIPGFAQPKAFPDQLKQLWKIPAGIGYSSPVVSGSHVFLHSRVGDDETASCYDLATGKVLWSAKIAAPYEMNPAASSHGKGPKSTPVVAEGKLYTLGISGILSCFDAASGKLLWRNDFRKQFPTTFPDFGTATSPLVDHGMLIVHVGGPDHGSLMALDANTGAQKWSWNGDGPGYSSPIVVELAGARQVVTQTQQNIVGVSESNGALLWKIPFTTAYIQNIVTPILYKDLLIFSGLEKGTFAVRLSQKDGAWVPETVWNNPRASMYMNSPVIVGDYLYGMDHYRRGQYFCLDLKTGATVWASDGDEGDNAAILQGGGVLFILNNSAELLVVKASEKKYEIVKKYTVAKSQTWAHPAIQGNKILIRDEDSLTLWSLE